jgi:hypothetical protein
VATGGLLSVSKTCQINHNPSQFVLEDSIRIMLQCYVAEYVNIYTKIENSWKIQIECMKYHPHTGRFWKRQYTTSPIRDEPNSGHVVMTVAMYRIRKLDQHVIWSLQNTSLAYIQLWYKRSNQFSSVFSLWAGLAGTRAQSRRPVWLWYTAY